MGVTPTRSGYPPVNGLKLYHEVYGELGASKPPLRALEVERAEVIGYSQGGGVALQLAIRHSFLVGKRVSMSATFRKDGWYPVALDAIGGLGADDFSGTPVQAAFQEAHAGRRRVRRPPREDEGFERQRQMRSISAPTVVIVGDADGAMLDHALAMFTLRGGASEEAAASGVVQETPVARLVVLSGMSYVGISGESEVLVPIVSAFLDDVVPKTPDLF